MFGMMRLTDTDGDMVLINSMHIVTVSKFVVPEAVATGQAKLPWRQVPASVVQLDNGQAIMVMQSVDDIDDIERLGTEIGQT